MNRDEYLKKFRHLSFEGFREFAKDESLLIWLRIVHIVSHKCHENVLVVVSGRKQMCISVYEVRFLNTDALPALEPDRHF